MIKRIFVKWTRRFRKVLAISLYFLLYHRKTMAKLSSYGLSEIRICQFKRWLRKKVDIKINRWYYTAKFDGKICFAKVATKDSTMRNEMLVNKYLEQCGITFVPTYLISDEHYDKDSCLIVTEFLPDIRNFEVSGDEKVFESICGKFEDIHNCFLKYGVIHGDINYTNVLLNSENHIILIDFGIGKSPDSDISQINMIIHCGSYYIESGDTRTYDDAYSFLRMMDDCGIPAEFKQKECYKRIEQLVGVHTYSVTIPLPE